MEMHKRRGTVTEPEARYFLHQIAKAGLYMHKNRVIHRDLKLGNLFLNDKMDIKVGDFGLATQLETDGDRKRQGTLNLLLLFFIFVFCFDERSLYFIIHLLATRIYIIFH